MKSTPAANASGVAANVGAGDRMAVSHVMPIVYNELRRLAGRYLRRERPGQTLQPTALVNEAYLRLLKDKKQNWQNRTHFLAIAALSMRQILIERARARAAAKRRRRDPRHVGRETGGQPRGVDRPRGH